jgi:hypothetical protein
MDQRRICLYLNRKEFSALAIQKEIVQLLGPDVIAYSTVTFHLRASRGMAETEERHSGLSPDVIEDAISRALNQSPFASVRELARSSYLPARIVWRRLTGSLGFIVKHLHWVPHGLTDMQWQIRIDRSIELLRLLESAQVNDWQSFMTLDESWFHLWTSHEILGVQAGQEPPERRDT